MNVEYLYESTIPQLKNNTSSIKTVKCDLKLYKNATILPIHWYGWENPQNEGGVLNQSGEYITESCQKNRFEKGYSVENTKFENRRVLYFGYFKKHWGHFLMECLTRMWVFASEYENYKDISIIYLPQDSSQKIDGNYLELLKLLGIRENQLEMLQEPTTFSEVLIPEKSNYIYGYYTREFKSIFEKIRTNALNASVEVEYSVELIVPNSL